MRAPVYFQSTDYEDISLFRGDQALIAAQMRPHARHKLPRREGLRDIVIGAEPEALHLVDIVPLGTHNQNRGVKALSDLAANLKSALPRQHQIQNHQIVGAAQCLLHALAPVEAEFRLKAARLQIVALQLRYALIVLDNQYAFQVISSICFLSENSIVMPFPGSERAQTLPP